MDLWVVAAAAGAGYAAKNLQNLSLDKEGSLTEPYVKYSVKVQTETRNFLQQLRDKTCPLRRLAGKTAQDDAFLEVYNPSDVNYFNRKSNRNLESEVAPSSGDTLGKNGLPEDFNLGWSSSLEYEEGKNRNFSRGKFIKSRKRGALISSEIRLDAQLCREHEMVENTICISAVRPVLVTQGSRIISRSSSDSSFVKFDGFREEMRMENGVRLKADDKTLKSASLEQFELDEELQEKPKTFLQQSGSNAGASSSQGPDRMLTFIIGMTVGILLATFASKSEVDKLNKKLHQTETLVQDLHDELDMKEILTVKELKDDGYLLPGEKDTPRSVQESNASDSDPKLNSFEKFHRRNENDEISGNPQLMSKIEAELEAELEVLEQNMKASALERISNIVEVDPDIINGDLGSGIANAIHVDSSSMSENGATDTVPNCTQPVNYAVCPWELSFRLHELIESRLEARIKELETDLGNSISFGRRYYSSEIESPHTFQSLGHIFEHGKREDGNPANNIFNKYPDDRSQDEHAWSSFMSNDDCRSEDDDGTEYESEILLLKQIVERMKSGSDMVLKF